jgi:hypothetical protein
MSICKALVILALLTSVCASAADVSGKWLGSSPGNKGAGTVFAVLRQDGAKLTGSAGPGESRQLPITTGTVEGDHLTFEVKMGGGTIHFDLTNIMSELRGTMQIVEDDGHTANSNVVLKRIPQ